MSEQGKLNLISEYETLKITIMNFGRDVKLKLIIDFSNKDQNGNKKRMYEEFRYTSNKYQNMDHLISGTMNFTAHLALEYPNQNKMSGMRSSVIFIRDYAIDGLLYKMQEFDNQILNAFMDKKGELVLNSGKVITVVSYPSMNSPIEFSQDIYEDAEHNKDVGVRIGLNNEYWFTIRMSTTWKKFLYYIKHCDLFGWASYYVTMYTNALLGSAVNEMGSGQYTSANRYSQFWEDPEDIVNRSDSVGINKSKPITKEEKKKSFFDE